MMRKEDNEIRRELDLPSVCDGNMLKLVTSHAQAMGVPQEYVFFPLLTSVAGFLGHSCVQINEEWRERCALWAAVVARRGTKRSAAVNRMVAPILQLSAELEFSRQNHVNGHISPTLHNHNNNNNNNNANNMNSENIHLLPDADLSSSVYSDCLKSSEPCRYVAVFEDIVSSRLLSSDGQQCAKKLYDSPALIGFPGPHPPRLPPHPAGPTTAHPNQDTNSLSFCSFLPPNDIANTLEIDNIDLCSRLLIACPKTQTFKMADIKTPLPGNTPCLKRVFSVLHAAHVRPQTYTLSAPAKLIFEQYHDTLQDGMVRFESDERNYCILSKAAGQLARVACSMAALRQALRSVVSAHAVTHACWGVEVSREDIEAAKLVMDYVIDIRFALLTRLNAFKASTSQALMMAPPMFNMSTQGAMVSSTGINGPGGGGGVAAGNIQQTVKRPRLSTERSPSETQTAVTHVNVLPNHPGVGAIPNDNPIGICAPGGVQQISAQTGTLPAFTHVFNVKPQVPQVNRHQTVPPLRLPVSTPHSPAAAPGMTGFPTPLPELSQQFPWENQAEEDLPSIGRRGYIDTTILTDDDLEGYSDSQKVFIRKFGYKIKKLLEYKHDFRVSPSACSQRHLMPPIPRTEMSRYDTQTRYPVIAAKEYLAKVASLGFGTIEASWSSINNRKSIHFVKHPLDRLSDSTRDLLVKLQVDVVDYMGGFEAAVHQQIAKHENSVPPGAGRGMLPCGTPMEMQGLGGMSDTQVVDMVLGGGVQAVGGLGVPGVAHGLTLPIQVTPKSEPFDEHEQSVM